MIKKLTYEELLQARKNIEEAKISNKFPISIILDNVRSLYNVGSIFRTCDSAFVNELILTGFTPFPPRKEITKTALGATETVVWRYEKNIIEAIKTQKNKCEKIIAVEISNTKRNCFSLTVEDFPACFVFGNELSGVSDEVLKECDDAVEIPMFGVKHSLNVGVAAGIVIYAAVQNLVNN